MTGKQLTRLCNLAKKISDTRTPATTHTTAGLFLRQGYVTEQLYRELHAACGYSPAHLANDLDDARVPS